MLFTQSIYTHAFTSLGGSFAPQIVGLIVLFSQRGVGYTTGIKCQNNRQHDCEHPRKEEEEGTQDPCVPGHLHTKFHLNRSSGLRAKSFIALTQTDRLINRQRETQTESVRQRVRQRQTETLLYLLDMKWRWLILFYVMIAFADCPVRQRDLP